MNSRILGLSALIAAVLVLSAVYGCQTIATPNIEVTGVTWGNSSHMIAAAPGDQDVPLTISLESYGTNCEFENVIGTLGPLYGGLTNFTGGSYSSYYIQSVQPPSLFNMVFHLNLASNISAGPYTEFGFPLVLEWESSNGTANVKQQINIEVPVAGSANLTFKAEDPDIIAGKITNVTLNVSNTGSGTASDISTQIPSVSGVSILSQPQVISSLAPNQTKSVNFSIYVAPSQAGNSQAGSSVVLDLNTHYIDPYDYNTTLNSNLGLFASVPSQSAVLVSVPNQTLTSGKIINTNLTITNQESDPLTNVSVVITPQSPLNIIGSDNLNTISRIAPGSTASLPISLYVQSSTSAVATLDIALTYVLDNQQQSITRSISFLNPGYVNATLVSTTISPTSPTIGGIFSITSTMDNIGSQSATAASVTPKPPSGIKTLGQNTSFLGSVPIDTPTAFTVSFTVSKSLKAGTYTIPVVFSYLNNLDQPQSETFYYNVSIGTSAFSSNTVPPGVMAYNGTSGYRYYRSSGSGYIYVVVGVIIVIAAACGIYLYMRRRGKKAHAK